MYQLHLLLNKFQPCLLRLEEVVRFRTVERVDRVPGVELGEARQVVDWVH